MIASAVLLGVTVASVWLGCLGFARLADPFDRLHCVTFVGVAAGLGVLLAGLAAQGATTAILKLTFLVVCALLNGAVLGHATGRALHHRAEDHGG